jgi:GMP synthase (glutamine-hydrolysing)
MIYLVDNSLDGKGDSPREIAAALQRLRPETPVVREHYSKVTPARVAELAPTHIILSGQPSPWTLYAPADLAGVYEVIRTARQPILGVCGGHQQIALCFGAPVGLMKRISPGEGYDGALRVRGYFEVRTTDRTWFELPAITVWESHCEEVKAVPDGFVAAASSETCAIEAMRHTSRPVFGVQFHPELFDDAHPHGRGILEHFLAT